MNKMIQKNRGTRGGTLWLLCRALVWIALTTSPDILFGQAYKEGRSTLMKNNPKAAEAQLTKALKAAKSKAELAETYKFLGVAQYMNGKQAAAKNSFNAAKSMNPAVRLLPSEVVDESVVKVFSQSSAPQARSTAARAATGAAAAGRVTAGDSVKKEKAKRTLLKVISNVPNARVSLDGIAYGTAGQEIEVSPGNVVVEVDSPGFYPKKIKVKLDPLTVSSVTVSLDKIAPKPQPAPKKPAVAGIPLPQAGGKASPNGGASGKKSKNDLFGGDDDLMDQGAWASDPALSPAPSTRQRQVVPPPAPAQPVMPPQGYGASPYAAPAPYTAPPMYAAPAYPAPYAQPYAQPYPQPYAPAYPAYPPMAPPAYAPSPYAPQPYGYAPQQNPYAYSQPAPQAPPPVLTAPADPYGGYLGPPPEAPSAVPPIADTMPSSGKSSGGGMPPPPILAPVGGSKTKSKSSSKGSDCSTLIKLMPLGAGQYCQGRTGKGTLFLAVEVGALYFYKSNSDAAASYQSKLNGILAEREAARTEVAESDLETYDAETAAKQSQGNAVINQAKQNAQYSMIAFVATWGYGAYDAMSYKGTSKSSKGSKKRRSRIIHSYNLDLETAPYGSFALTAPELPYSSGEFDSPFVAVGYTPVDLRHNGQLSHALTVGLSMEL